MTGNRTINEGVRAGLLGAAAVAFWFFVVDIVTARPLHTPLALGQAVLATLGLERGQGTLEVVAVYTLLHVVAFIIVGMLAAWIINASEGEPSHLAGLFLLFAAFEAGVHLYIYGLSTQGQQVELAWYQIGAANIVAAYVMGRYLFKAHPGTLHNMNEALAGRT